jgi:adenylyltransferase/sulfurtransferase
LIDYEEFCGLRTPSQTTDASSELEEITATELKQRIDRGDKLQIIDVREPGEYEIARIAGARLIPLGEVVNRRQEIDAGRETIVHCKAGVRSARAIASLKQAGFAGRLINLKGGITAWSDEVDPSVAKY